MIYSCSIKPVIVYVAAESEEEAQVKAARVFSANITAVPTAISVRPSSDEELATSLLTHPLFDELPGTQTEH